MIRSYGRKKICPKNEMEVNTPFGTYEIKQLKTQMIETFKINAAMSISSANSDTASKTFFHCIFKADKLKKLIISHYITCNYMVYSYQAV